MSDLEICIPKEELYRLKRRDSLTANLFNSSKRNYFDDYDFGDRHRRRIVKSNRISFSFFPLSRYLHRYKVWVLLIGFYGYLLLSDRQRLSKKGLKNDATPISTAPVYLPPPLVSKDVAGSEPEKGVEFKRIISTEDLASFKKLAKKSNFDERGRLLTGDPSFRSFYHCLGKQNDILANERRPCRFHNVCFNPTNLDLQYYIPYKEPVFYDALKGPLYTFEQSESGGFIQVNSLGYGYVSRITPIVVYGSPADPVWVNDTTVVWASWSYEYNLGHFLYEELASAYFALVRFGILPMDSGINKSPKGKKTILLDMRYNVENKRYQSLLKSFSGAISTSKVEGLWEFVQAASAQSKANGPVCFRDLVVASATRAFLSPRDEFQFGTEPIWFKYRNDLLEFNKVDASFVPTKHRIVLIHKEGSMYKEAANRSHFRDIVNFDEMVDHIKATFKQYTIDVVNPALLDMKEQMDLMIKTTILITPPGGVSMLIPFLPPNSNVIIFDYYGQQNDLVMTSEGESVSMESSLWNVFPHIRKHYYQILDPVNDIVADFEEAIDTREDFSVKVDLDRVEYLVNACLAASTLL